MTAQQTGDDGFTDGFTDRFGVPLSTVTITGRRTVWVRSGRPYRIPGTGNPALHATVRDRRLPWRRLTYQVTRQVFNDHDDQYTRPVAVRRVEVQVRGLPPWAYVFPADQVHPPNMRHVTKTGHRKLIISVAP